MTSVNIAATTSSMTFYFKDNSTQNVTLSATDNAHLLATGTDAVVVNPSPVHDLLVAGYPTPTVAGVSHNLTVTAQDSFGNTVTSYTGTVSFTSSDTAAGLPASYTFQTTDAGTKTFAVTFKTAGTQGITATDSGNSVSGNQTGITVNAASAATLAVSAFPTTTTAGVAHTATVTALDAYNNVATGYLGTIRFTSGDTQATLPANYTFSAGDNGAHTFTNGVTLATAPTQAITATDTVTGTITGTENGITVTPATATKLVLGGPLGSDGRRLLDDLYGDFGRPVRQRLVGRLESDDQPDEHGRGRVVHGLELHERQHDVDFDRERYEREHGLLPGQHLPIGHADRDRFRRRR